ncbi:unnamed protein product [Acanthocheilonema viteae]|uniref:MOFRL-associated domain-containing protein n=1 Tax=Acanthocheilonema viteae TaxID=6277 RepID=A0A498SZX8_ACAVI|nr:unnamed protein product [Acanthocheilonema viteae]
MSTLNETVNRTETSETILFTVLCPNETSRNPTIDNSPPEWMTLCLTNGCIKVGQRIYRVNHNVHLVAFGKAALHMVRGAEDALDGHIIESIASVPRCTLQKLKNINLRTEFLEGATNNLPDEDACNNDQLVEEMAERLQTSNDIFLVVVQRFSISNFFYFTDDERKTINAMTSREANINQELNAWDTISDAVRAALEKPHEMKSIHVSTCLSRILSSVLNKS